MERVIALKREHQGLFDQYQREFLAEKRLDNCTCYYYPRMINAGTPYVFFDIGGHPNKFCILHGWDDSLTNLQNN